MLNHCQYWTPGQKVLFLSPKQQNQYIKTTVTPRSYYVESQGKTYHHTCQHLCTINTDIPVSQDHQQFIPVPQDHCQGIVPLSQDHRSSNIPVSQDHHSSNIPVSQGHHSSNLQVSQDHCSSYIPVSLDHHCTNIPISQDHHCNNISASQDHQRYNHKSIKPASTQYHHQNKGSKQQPDISVNPTARPQSETTTDQLLKYLVAINGHSTIQLPHTIQDVIPTPTTPRGTTSEQQLTCSNQQSTSYNTEGDTTTSDDETITSIASDRQLRPSVPISYNETVLKCLHRQPQVRTLNYVPIPLPSDSSSEDTDTELKIQMKIMNI